MERNKIKLKSKKALEVIDDTMSLDLSIENGSYVLDITRVNKN